MGRKRKENVIYMAIDNSIYEFPYAVCDTAEELAEECGVELTTVYSQICRQRRGKRARYIEVFLSDDDYKDIKSIRVLKRPLTDLEQLRIWLKDDKSDYKEFEFETNYECKKKRRCFRAEISRNSNLTVKTQVIDTKIILKKEN